MWNCFLCLGRAFVRSPLDLGRISIMRIYNKFQANMYSSLLLSYFSIDQTLIKSNIKNIQTMKTVNVI